MTTLQNSYTVPMTLDEWVQCVPWLKDDPLADDIVKCAFVAYGDGTIAKKPRDGMVRLSVPRFLDLLNDRVATWRVEELGGVKEEDCNSWIIECGQKICVGFFLDGSVTIGIHYDYASIPLHISIFTDLLALIRMLTPPSND
jgi:hypothetical protein